MDKCICKEELGYWDSGHRIYIHLAWCPESYFYREAVADYERASWFGKLFLRDPRKYRNFLMP